MRAGVIGCGGLGKVHTECLQQVEGMKMVAFCDVVGEKAEVLRGTAGGDYATTEPRRLFEDASLSAIYVCTQHDSHAQLCIEALEAGKAVMVEKPLALTVEDCVRIAQTVERTGGMLMTAFKMRYFDMILKAKELIPRPLVVTMQIMDNRWPNDMWANDPIKGGGNVLSQGCHGCDVLRFVAGAEPLQVYAAGGNYYQATGVVDNVCATFRLDNGAAASWVNGDPSCPPYPSKFYLQAFAEGKSVTLDKRLTHLVYQEAGKEPLELQGSETGFVEENRAFVQAIRSGSPAPIDHKDGLMATLMPLQAIASLRSGRPEPVLDIFQQAVRQARAEA
ncbi:MAG: Gfo/Idh/MocA family protein [Anaerolineae bacterium]